MEIARDTAMRFTKGRHQFVVAVHTNTNCIHSHTFFNSVDLDCSRKFKDFKFSALALRRVSDHICAEHGLSIIENPGLSKGRDYAEYMQGRKPPTAREKLQDLIDCSLVVGESFGEFLVRLKHAGCEVKMGKHTAVKIPGGKKNIRFDSLDGDHNEAAIIERLMGTRSFTAKIKSDGGAERKTAEYIESARSENAPGMLIDIQAKLRQGYGAGYKQWASVYNIKQMAKTLVYLKEIGIDSYDDLKKKASEVSGEFSRLGAEISGIEAKQKEIAELQKYIGQYGKNRATYEAYRKSGWDTAFYEANRAAITLHKVAKDYFDKLGASGKLPSINMLKQEWAALDAKKRSLYRDYHAIKPRHKELQTALMNAENILNGKQLPEPEREAQRKTRDNGAR